MKQHLNRFDNKVWPKKTETVTWVTREIPNSVMHSECCFN